MPATNDYEDGIDAGVAGGKFLLGNLAKTDNEENFRASILTGPRSGLDGRFEAVEQLGRY